ncbi:Ras-GEF domain-containing protein [Plasmodiophora brassicae]|nr:hypothetical protein PBRA_006965 [Plasmodiophora brassicae]
MEVEEIKRRSGQMDPLLLAEYVDLHSGYGQAMQSSKVMPLMGSDPTVFRNLGFSFAVSPGSTYVFDEPDAPENCLTQQVGGDASSKARIKAATLAKLIEKLSDPASPPDLHQRFALLATFPMVAQAEEILELMIRRCNVPCAPNMTPSELAAYKTARLAPMQIRVLALLKYWLHEFPDDFLRNPNVKAMFEQQMNELSTSPEPWSKTSASNMLETLRRLEASASTPIDESAERFPNAPGDAITSFLDVAEDDFVQAICYEDSRAFVKINAREFVDQAWSKRPESAPNITAMIARFNRMTSFVQATILGQDALARRVVVLKKFIKLSELFRAARNYNAVFAIYASLNANAIYRLKQTWEALPAKVRASFDELKTLFSVDNNSRAFRAEMKTLEPPCVPHLGLVLQDLTFIDDGNPDRHQHNMVNFQKMCIMADRIGWIRDCQRIPYRIDPALYGAALQYIQRTFVLVDVETLWTLSQLVEPRRKQPGA